MLPANWINLIAFVLCDIVNIIKSPWHRQSYYCKLISPAVSYLYSGSHNIHTFGLLKLDNMYYKICN